MCLKWRLGRELKSVCEMWVLEPNSKAVSSSVNASKSELGRELKMLGRELQNAQNVA